MATQPGTNKQVPEHSILDHFDKQVYLGNQFIFTNPISVGTAETPILLLSNPLVAAQAFPGQASLFVNLNKLVCVTASQNVIVRSYLAPTVTGAGTAKTAVNLRSGSPSSSVATLATSPTASANGTLVQMLASNAFSPDMSSILTIVDPGKIMLITAQASAASTALISETSWFEI